MNMQTSEREATLLHDITAGRPVSLERALLILSGLETDEALGSYQHKIQDIWGRFLSRCDHKILFDDSIPPAYWHRSIAKWLFDYLWNSKPKRFGAGFLLTEVVDAQLDSDIHHAVGTCVGLTSLYSVLGLRAGLNLSLLAASDHLLSRLRVEDETMDMDHTDPLGFDCRTSEDLREFPLLTLTANVLNSRGLIREGCGRLAEARWDYGDAVRVNPEYANGYNNLGNMKCRDGDIQGAIADYTEAIRLDPNFCEAYCNRGMARHRLGLLDEARQDYLTAMSTNGEYAHARTCLEVLDAVAHDGAMHWQASCR